MALTPLAVTAPARATPSSPAPWPSDPDWHQYVMAPSSRDARPVRVVEVSGDVTNAAALVGGGTGVTTLTRKPGDTAAPTIVLDYGEDVGGIPEFTVSDASGSPTMRSGYSETHNALTDRGDNGPGGVGWAPWGNGDPQRFDDYTVSGPGKVTNRFVQGGERYQEITLTSPGSVSLTKVGIFFEPYLGTPDTYRGYFVSSDEQLNKTWYGGAYTVQLNQMRPGTPSGAWAIESNALSIAGGGIGLLSRGQDWKDYTMSFKAVVDNNQAGWVVRGNGADTGYVLILNAHNDSAGQPDSLQQLVFNKGAISGISTVKLPFAIDPGTAYKVDTKVEGTKVSTSINGVEVASFDSAAFPVGTPALTGGTVGFRQGGGEQARFSDLTVTDPAGKQLYANPLDSAAALSDFTIPGENTLPLLLDGAKRDRAVWEGDITVAAPTLYYSSGATEYARESLRLLGSYQYTSGFVTGCLSPSQPLNTGGLLPGDVGCYSATYSMQFVSNLADYYRYTGDTGFLKEEWATAQRELAWSGSKVGSNGLFVTDSTDDSTWNLENHSGELTEANAIYYKTLVDGAWLAQELGRVDDAAAYRAKAKQLRDDINSHLWDEKIGAYDASTARRGFVAQDANALAVFYGIADQEQTSRILAAMKAALWTKHGSMSVSAPKPDGWTQDISPYMNSFEVWARLANGDTDNALDLVHAMWDPMTAGDPGGTAWERLNTDGTIGYDGTSMAHAWSTGATSALSAYVMGAEPVEAGYKTWLVEPHPGEVKWVNGQAPTPYGPLGVKWGRTGEKRFAMQVTVPDGTTGTIAVPYDGHGSVFINDRELSATHKEDGAVRVLGTSGGYLRLAVSHSGTYNIVTNHASQP